MIAFTIMTICKVVVQDEKIELIHEDQDELVTSQWLMDPRLYFLKAYVPLVED